MSYNWSNYLSNPYALKNGSEAKRRLSAKAQRYVDAVDPCRIYRMGDLFALYDCGQPGADELNLSFDELEKLLEGKDGGNLLADYHLTKDEAEAEGRTVELSLSYSGSILDKGALLDARSPEGQKALEALIPEALPVERIGGHEYLNGERLVDESWRGASDGRIYVDGEKYERLALYENDEDGDPVEQLIDFGWVRI